MARIAKPHSGYGSPVPQHGTEQRVGDSEWVGALGHRPRRQGRSFAIAGVLALLVASGRRRRPTGRVSPSFGAVVRPAALLAIVFGFGGRHLALRAGDPRPRRRGERLRGLGEARRVSPELLRGAEPARDLVADRTARRERERARANRAGLRWPLGRWLVRRSAWRSSATGSGTATAFTGKYRKHLEEEDSPREGQST